MLAGLMAIRVVAVMFLLNDNKLKLYVKKYYKFELADAVKIRLINGSNAGM